jgi:membrane complex biogenesis BtpA family protein
LVCSICLPCQGLPLGNPAETASLESVLQDAQTLVEGGVQGLMLGNFGDAPFFPGRVPAATIASMTALAFEVRRNFDVPLGINVLRNDGVGALAVASATGAEFIRVNLLCGARLTDQGIIQGIAHDLLRERKMLGVGHIRIFSDIDVKHSTPLGPPLSPAVEAVDMISRGRVDALIISGSGTGRPADISDAECVKKAVGNHPILIGSGVSARNIGSYLDVADGFIIGSAFKYDGVVTNPVDPARVREITSQVSLAVN